MTRLLFAALLGLCLAGCVHSAIPDGQPVKAGPTANDGGGGGGY